MSFGRICPFEFEDGICREMPEEKLLNHYFGSEYEWLFMGTFWERLQTIEYKEVDYIWKPPCHEHPWVKTLTMIIHHTVQLIEKEIM